MTETDPTSTTTSTAIDPETLVNGGTHVHVKHRDTGAEWDSPIDYLPIAELAGWVPTAPPAPTYAEYFDAGVLPGTADTTGATGPVETGYNPDEHTNDEVNTYLDQLLGNSPGEVARVLEVEAAGQARKGIIHGRHGTPENDPDDQDDAGEPDAADTPTDDASLQS